MQHDDFIDAVRRRGDLESNDQAEAATIAVLQTLSERLTLGQAQEIAGDLPDELAGPMTDVGASEGAEELPPEGFVERVRDKELDRRGDIDDPDAERHVQAVMEALADTISQEQWQGLQAQLPEEYASLYERAP